jgi:hypothetical protein
MAKWDRDKLLLAGMVENKDSDGKFDYESVGSAHSKYLNGGSSFRERSVCRKALYTIHQQFTARHANNLDYSVYHCVNPTRG